MTRLYFDVDGVFNALPYRKTELVTETGWSTWESVEVNGYTITYSPQLVAAVNEIAARPDTDVRWLTTWCGDAPGMIAPAIGLDGADWPVLGTKADVDHNNRFGWWWKFLLIQDDMESTDDRAIWIDDDLAYGVFATRGVAEWLEDREDQVLGLTPKTHLGLTQADIGEINIFLDRVQADSVVV